MFLTYKAHNSPHYLSYLQRLSTLTAFAVVCVLFIHSFDTCAAHWGAFANSSIGITQIIELCPNGTSTTCDVCAARDKHNDGCNSFAEIAVLSSSQHQLNPQPATMIATFFIIPATPQLITLSGSLDPRAGPSFAAPLSICLRSSLPVRAPPYSI